MSNNPCLLNLKKYYPDKDERGIRLALTRMKAIQGKYTTRAELRIAQERWAKEKALDVRAHLLGELDTIGKASINIDRIGDKAWGKDHLQAGLSFLEDTSSNVANSGINIEATTRHYQKLWSGSVEAEMQGSGVMAEYESSIFKEEVNAVMMTGEAHKGVGAETINEIARILKKYYNVMNGELNSNGMIVKNRLDYDGPVVHDGTAINGRFSDWLKLLNKTSDFHKIFKEIPTEEIKAFQEMAKRGDEIPEDHSNAVVKSLKYSYDKITAEDSLHIDEKPRALERPSSIADRRSRAKSFDAWNDAASLQAYLNEFGKYKTPKERMDYYARSAGRDMGLVSIFGGTPRKGFEMMKDNVIGRMKHDKVATHKITDAENQLEIAWNNVVRGNTLDAGSVGRSAMAFRQATAQSKLGMSGVTSLLMDPAATSLQRSTLLNEGLVTSLYKTYAGMIKAAKELNRADVELAYTYSNFDLQNNLGEIYSNSAGAGFLGKVEKGLKMSGAFVSLISGGHHANKLAAINNGMMWIHELSVLSKANKFTDVELAHLKKFGITPNDLKIIQNLEFKNGMRDIFKLGTEDLMALEPGKYRDAREAGFELSSLKERMNLWLIDKVRTGAPMVGNREKRLLLGGTEAGTLKGEIPRFFTQFKMTALKVFLDSTVGANRRLAPNAMQGGKGSVVNFKNKDHMWHASQTMALMTSLGAMNILINAVLSNDEKQLERFASGDITLLPESMSRGGAGFIAGDFMNFQSDKSRALVNIVGTPALTGMVTPFTDIGTAITGKSGSEEKAAIDMAKTFIPGANHWAVKLLLNGMSDSASAHKKSHGN